MVNSIVEFFHVQMKFHISFVKIHDVEFWLIILFEDNRILDWQLQNKDVEEKNKLKLHWSEKEKGLLRGERLNSKNLDAMIYYHYTIISKHGRGFIIQ